MGDFRSAYNYINCQYLGGLPDYSNAKQVNLRPEDEGLVGYSTVLNRKLFLIAWPMIHGLQDSSELRTKDSALGRIMEGVGLISLGAGNPNPLAGLGLVTTGAAKKNQVKDHILLMTYSLNGIAGVAKFKFTPSFFNKEPVMKAISWINGERLKRAPKSKSAR